MKHEQRHRLDLLRRVLVWNVLVAEYGCSEIDWWCVMRDYAEPAKALFRLIRNSGFELSEKQQAMVAGFIAVTLSKEYEAGQRDMRERAAALCLDRYHVRSAESDACDELHEEIRAIKLESEQ